MSSNGKSYISTGVAIVGAISAIIYGYAAPVGAQTQDSDSLRAFGLLGRLAEDCTRPPCGTDIHIGCEPNLHVRYFLSRDGNVVLEQRNNGLAAAKVFSHSVVSDVQLLSEDSLTYKESTRSGLFADGAGAASLVVILKSGETFGVWEWQAANGQIIVQNGRFVSSGLETPLLAKCDE